MHRFRLNWDCLSMSRMVVGEVTTPKIMKGKYKILPIFGAGKLTMQFMLMV